MRQFTDISVSKWDDPRASALTSYSIPASQAKTAKYARVLGSAPLKQTYQLANDDDDDDDDDDNDDNVDEESSENSGDEQADANDPSPEDTVKEPVPEENLEEKRDEPSAKDEKGGGEEEEEKETNTSAKGPESSQQEKEVALAVLVGEPDDDPKTSSNGVEGSETNPTSTSEGSDTIDDSSKESIVKENPDDPNASTEDGGAGDVTQATEAGGEGGGSRASEQATLNESGTSEPDQVTSAPSDDKHEGQEIIEGDVGDIADDQRHSETSKSPTDKKDTVTPENDVTQVADISKGDSEDVKNKDEDAADTLADPANETKNNPEDHHDSNKDESSSRLVSFAANVKGPKPATKSSKSKKKKSAGKEKAIPVNDLAQKARDKSTVSSPAAEDDSNKHTEPASDTAHAKDTTADENAPVTTESIPKKLEPRMAYLGKQSHKKTKKNSKKKVKVDNVEDMASDKNVTSTLQEDSNKPDAISTTVAEAQGPNDDTPGKNDDNKSVDVKHELAGDNLDNKENTEKGSNEDKHVVERTNEPIIANDAENPDENNTGLAADFSEDTGKENGEIGINEKLKTDPQPSSGDDKECNSNSADLSEQIEKECTGDDQAAEDPVIEPKECDNIVPKSIEESKDEKSDQVADTSAERKGDECDAAGKEVSTEHSTPSTDVNRPESPIHPKKLAVTIGSASTERTSSVSGKAEEKRKTRSKDTPGGKSTRKKKSSKKDIKTEETSPPKVMGTAESEQTICIPTQNDGSEGNSAPGEDMITNEVLPAVAEKSAEIANKNGKKEDAEKFETQLETASSEMPPTENEHSDTNVDANGNSNSQQEEEEEEEEASKKDNELNGKEDITGTQTNIEPVDEDTMLSENNPIENEDPASEDSISVNEDLKNTSGNEEATNEGFPASDVTEAEPSKEAVVEESSIATCGEKNKIAEDLESERHVNEESANMIDTETDIGDDIDDTEQNSSTRQQPAQVENSVNGHNVIKDEGTKCEKLDEKEPVLENISQVNTNDLEANSFTGNSENMDEQQEDAEEGQTSDEKLDQVDEGELAVEKLPIEQVAVTGRQVTEENDATDSEKNDSKLTANNDEHLEKQLCSDESEGKDNTTPAKRESFVSKEGTNAVATDEDSAPKELGANTANHETNTESYFNAENKPEEQVVESEKTSPSIAKDQGSVVDGENVICGETVVNFDKPEEAKESGYPNDFKESTESKETPLSVNQVNQVEMPPVTVVETKAAETAFASIDDTPKEDGDISQGDNEKSFSQPDNIDTELQKDRTKNDTQADQQELSTGNGEAIQNTESDKSLGLKNQALDDRILEADNISLEANKPPLEKPLQKSSSSNLKDKKPRRDSMRKTRRSSAGSFLSMNVSNRSKQDSHGNKENANGQKSKSKRAEEERLREEKRKRREADKDDEIRFLRKRLARYEENQKRDEEKRHQSRNLRKSNENNTGKDAKRASHRMEKDEKDHGQDKKTKAEKERKKVSKEDVLPTNLERGSAGSKNSTNDNSTAQKHSERRNLPVEMKTVKLPSSLNYPRHSESYRSNKEDRPPSSRRLNSLSTEKWNEQPSNFERKANVVNGTDPPPISPRLANASSSRNKDEKSSRSQEARCSRRTSHRNPERDRRRNSVYEKDKGDSSIITASKTLFSGIKNVLAKA